MKISDEEIRMALMELARTNAGNHVSAASVRTALKAAYTVRKARKAAKRAKAKPSILDKDQRRALLQANMAQFTVSSKTISAICDRWKADLETAKQAQTEPAKPEWNGKFEVGKAYRTRDGRKATVTERYVDDYPLRGVVRGKGMRPKIMEGTWTDQGRTFRGGKEIPLDLVGPWED